MLDNNRNSGENIGIDVDPAAWMDANATDPRQEIWRRTYSYEGDVDGKHYARACPADDQHV